MARLMSSRRSRRGLATIEMALILPLLLILVFGVIEYGWLFFKNQQISSAARNACRYAITQPATTGNTFTMVDTLMTQSGFTPGDYSVTISTDLYGSVVEVPAGNFITVTITMPYDLIKLTGFPLPLPTDLIGETTMAKEGPPL